MSLDPGYSGTLTRQANGDVLSTVTDPFGYVVECRFARTADGYELADHYVAIPEPYKLPGDDDV